MKPKTGEGEAMVPVSKNSEQDHSIWLCALCAPMVCDLYHTWKTLIFEIESRWLPNYAYLRLLPGKLRLLKAQDFSKMGGSLLYDGSWYQ